MPERTGLAGDPRGVALVADSGHDVGSGALDGERARAHPPRPACASTGARLPGEDRLVEREPVRRSSVPVGDDLVTGLDAHEVAHDDVVDGGSAGPRRPARPSRWGATSAASRSSARFARTSCVIPIAELATRTPRKSASCHSPNASVSPPNTARIRLKTVKTFARTMLEYERLVAGGSRGRARRAGA